MAESPKDHPISGVGIGRFASLAPGYSGRVEPRVIPPDNAQNLWRQTLAERGLLGAAPVVWLTVLTVRALVRRQRRDDPAHASFLSTPPRASPVVLRAMVVGLGVAMVFGYPLQDPAVGVTLATVVGYALAGVEPAGRPNDSPWPAWLGLALMASALAGAALDYAG
jgi:hypothetical protein